MPQLFPLFPRLSCCAGPGAAAHSISWSMIFHEKLLLPQTLQIEPIDLLRAFTLQSSCARARGWGKQGVIRLITFVPYRARACLWLRVDVVLDGSARLVLAVRESVEGEVHPRPSF